MVFKEPDVMIVDCGPRDGLATAPVKVSTADKLLLINSLSETGIRKIDSVAFTHPRVIPQDSDAEDVMQQLKKKPGVSYVGLAPSEIGCRRAVNTSIDEVLTLMVASEAFSQAVMGQSTKDVVNKTMPALIDVVAGQGKKVRTYLSTAFGCPYSGAVSPSVIVDLVWRLDFMGVNEISLVDNTGMANPVQVKNLVGKLLDLNLKARLAVHFHDTRGSAMANAIAAFEAGIRIFDTAVGGASGTPYGAPEIEKGRWNIATEDMVHLFEEMGISTGVDLDRLLSSVQIAEQLLGRSLPGHIKQAGPRRRLADVPEHLRMR